MAAGTKHLTVDMSETQDAHAAQGAGQAAAAELKAVLIERLRTCTSSPRGAGTGALLRALRLCERFLSHARGSREDLATLKADVQAALSQPVCQKGHRQLCQSLPEMVSGQRCCTTLPPKRPGAERPVPTSCSCVQELQALQAPC